jgi:hypothetical protein
MLAVECEVDPNVCLAQFGLAAILETRWAARKGAAPSAKPQSDAAADLEPQSTGQARLEFLSTI